MENLFLLIDKILPLLSTLLGAYITYFVTVSSKKNDLKVNAQLKSRDDYWIPLSISIENLKNKISDNTKKEGDYVSFWGSNSCEAETRELIKYLQADKRIYFHKRTRNLLASLSENIDDFENAVNNDIVAIQNNFKHQYALMLENFSIYSLNNCKDSTITVKKTLAEEIKVALLTHRSIVWYGQLSNITLYKGECPFADYIPVDMSYPDGDFYIDIWCELREFDKSIDDFYLSPEQENGIAALDFESENLGDICNVLNDIIVKKDYSSKYTAIFESLDLLQNELLNDIDAATIL